jgi:hypothetical protein
LIGEIRLPGSDRILTRLLVRSKVRAADPKTGGPRYRLIALQKHAEELAKNPAVWMPWNYAQALPPVVTSHPPA